MAKGNQPQQVPAAGGCLVTFNQNFPPPTATAKPGTLRFKLAPISNLIFFIPGACSVTDDGGANVPFNTATASGLSFPAVAGKTYTLTVAYLVAPPGHPASAKFQEDCAGATGGITIDQTTGGADYTIQVN